MSQYHVIVNKQQQGPFEEAALVEGFRSGTYPAGTLVWCTGMPDWKPIETVVAEIGNPAAAPAAAPAAVDVPVVPPAVPAAAPAPAAPAAPAQPSAFGVKMKAFAEKTTTFVKEFPAKAKTFTAKQWCIVGGAAAAVLALIIVLFCLMPKSFSSDQDVKDYLDKKAEAIKKIDSKLGTEFKKALPEMKKALKDDASDGDKAKLAALMASFGEKGAMVYFFEKKDFPARAADEAFASAAGNGQVHVMKYLKDKHCSGDEKVFESAFEIACMTGQLDACEYLVEKCDVSVEDKHLYALLDIDKDGYKAIAKQLSAYKGSKMEADELMENVAKVAKYLKKKGASVDNDELIDKCQNPALKKVLKGK